MTYHYLHLDWVLRRNRAVTQFIWYEDGRMVYVTYGEREYRQLDRTYYIDTYIRGYRGSDRFPRTNVLTLFYPRLKKVGL